MRGYGLPFWLAEVPLKDLRAVLAHLAVLIAAAKETASVPSA
jgi:hypothetical protein